MELYQEIRPCPNCGTRLTVSGQREPASGSVVRYEIDCPVCRTGVTFTIRGAIERAEASLICYERPPGFKRRAVG